MTISAGRIVQESATGDLYFVQRIARCKRGSEGTVTAEWLAQRVGTDEVVIIRGDESYDLFEIEFSKLS